MRRILLSAIPAAVILLAGCAKERGNEHKGTLPGMARVEFTLETAGYNQPQGRDTEPGDAAESIVTQIEFYAFGTDGTLGRYYSVAAPVTYPVAFTLPAGAYEFCVVANQGIGTVADKTALLAKMTAPALDASNSRDIPSAGFPIVGQVVSRTYNGGGTTPVTVQMKRRIAKICPPVSMAAYVVLADQTGLDQVLPGAVYQTNTDLLFYMNGYAVANGIDVANLCRAGTWSMTGKQYQPSTFAGNGAYTSVYSGDVGGGNFFLNPLAMPARYVYVNENYPEQHTVGTETGYLRDEVYAMIIRGTITGKNVSDQPVVATRYWRVNLVKDGNYQVTENTVYKVTVSGITTLGYATPEEAEREPNKPAVIPLAGQAAVSFSLEMLEWEIFPQATELN